MTRNITRTLTTDEAAVVAYWSQTLFTLTGHAHEARVTYVKSDGTAGVAEGLLTRIQGDESTLSVTIDTVATKGRPTSVNVRNITDIIMMQALREHGLA